MEGQATLSMHHNALARGGRADGCGAPHQATNPASNAFKMMQYSSSYLSVPALHHLQLGLIVMTKWHSKSRQRTSVYLPSASSRSTPVARVSTCAQRSGNHGPEVSGAAQRSLVTRRWASKW